MSDPVITVENLSKRYLIGHEGPRERYLSLRDTLVRRGKNFTRKTVDMVRGRQIIQGDEVEEFWALKDVSFQVERGEVLGIIGRNGAGKSTLLKILSRITEPTEGRVTLRGRVASLLEVGTGFHPELTGRENIFLNGAILGMARAEINRKFDEIVDFAGVEKFLDTPVKRYSSGLYVRLAFAVAAHLEPEILVVDEVLAVGDTEFQKKCLGKMQDVAKGGRTVLFVSHNMTAVSNLTIKSILLGKGQLVRSGFTKDIINYYINSQKINEVNSQSELRSGNRSAIRKISSAGNGQTFARIENTILSIYVEIVTDGGGDLCIEGYLVDEGGNAIGFFSPEYFGGVSLRSGVRDHHMNLNLTLPDHLASGQYSITLSVAERMLRVDLEVPRAISFEVASCNPANGNWNLEQNYGKGFLAIKSVISSV